MKTIFKTILKNSRGIQKYVSKNASLLLTAAGISGVGITAYEACKVTPKAIEDYNTALESGQSKPAAVLNASKNYIRAGIVGASTIFCIAESYNKSARTIKDLRKYAALLSATETSFQAYKDKVVELEGPAEEEKIRAAIAKDKVYKESIPQPIIDKGLANGFVCKDMWSGRYFVATHDEIRSATSKVNEILRSDREATVNDFYDALDNSDLEPNDSGRDVGWNIEDGELIFTPSTILDKFNRPCLCVEFNIMPTSNYTERSRR